MLNLQDQCDLPIMFDEKDEKFIFGEDLLYDTSEKIPLRSLIPALLNKSLVYPSEVYEEHRNIRFAHDDERIKNNIIYDIVFLPEGLLGVEYIKSHIYYSPNGDSPGSVSTIVEVISGTVTILLQKNMFKGELDFETKTEDMFVIMAETGEKIILPKGYYYTFINTGERPVIIARVYRNKGLIDYTILRKEQGLAYFCIRKNARCEFVKNPRYREIQDIRYQKAEETLNRMPVNTEQALYKQVVDEIDSFIEMLWS